ncbi:hypothetical protein C0J52_08487, partial [Blattella germanica]
EPSLTVFTKRRQGSVNPCWIIHTANSVNLEHSKHNFRGASVVTAMAVRTSCSPECFLLGRGKVDDIGPTVGLGGFSGLSCEAEEVSFGDALQAGGTGAGSSGAERDAPILACYAFKAQLNKAQKAKSKEPKAKRKLLRQVQTETKPRMSTKTTKDSECLNYKVLYSTSNEALVLSLQGISEHFHGKPSEAWHIALQSEQGQPPEILIGTSLKLAHPVTIR